MSQNRIVVYDTVKVPREDPPDFRIWFGLIGFGLFLYLQYLVGIEFDAVLKTPLDNLPYTVFIGLAFVFMYLVEIVLALIIIGGILGIIAMAAIKVCKSVKAAHSFLKRVFIR